MLALFVSVRPSVPLSAHCTTFHCEMFSMISVVIEYSNYETQHHLRLFAERLWCVRASLSAYFSRRHLCMLADIVDALRNHTKWRVSIEICANDECSTFGLW